jgi:hypothetical protein
MAWWIIDGGVEKPSQLLRHHSRERGNPFSAEREKADGFPLSRE